MYNWSDMLDGGRAGMPSFCVISIASAMYSFSYVGLAKSLLRRAENLHKVWYEGVGIKIKNPMTNKRRKVRQQHLNLFEPTNISL